MNVEKKLIVYIADIPLFPSTGPAIHIDEICKNLQSLGNNVVLIAPAILPRHMLDKDYKKIFISTTKIMSTVVFQVKLIFLLRRLISKNKQLALYVRSDHLLIVPALVSKLFGVRLVLEYNGKILQEFSQVRRGLMKIVLAKSGLLYFIEQLNIKTATLIVCVSEGIRQDLLKRYKLNKDKTVVITNGVDVDKFVPMSRRLARRALGLDQKSKYVIFVGALPVWQNIEEIISAFALLKQERARCYLILVGDDKKRMHLMNFAKKQNLKSHIIFTGSVSSNQVISYINAADVCLYYPMPSRGDGASPLKVYEYLACNATVLAANLPGLYKEFGNFLKYCDPNSSKALSLALRDLLFSSPAKLKTIQGRSFITEHHKWLDVASRIEQAIKSIAQENIN